MENRNEVLGLDHVVLRVRDLTKSIAFYRAIMGARIERRLQVPHLVQLRIGDSLLDLVPGRKRKAEADHNMDHYAVRVANLDPVALARRLRKFGITPGDVKDRYGAEGYGPSVYFSDPDGNTLEFKGPATRPRIDRKRKT